MKYIFLLLIIFYSTSCCRDKEVFPDLGKQIEGRYNIFQASFVYANPYQNVSDYNPKDSAQIGQIILQKIDPLSARVTITLTRNSGEVFYTYSFDCELARDVHNKGFINFNTGTNDAGSYQPDRQIIDVTTGGYGTGRSGTATASFFARR